MQQGNIQEENFQQLAENQDPDATSPVGSPDGSGTHSPSGSPLQESLQEKAPSPVPAKMAMTPWGGFKTTVPQQNSQQNQEPDLHQIKQSNKADREALLETFHKLQKERRDLRKRNLRAQTNIAQYMRKHGVDIVTLHDADRSQSSLRDEYNELLNKIEELAAAKDTEEKG